jgi:hypothetical protein
LVTDLAPKYSPAETQNSQIAPSIPEGSKTSGNAASSAARPLTSDENGKTSKTTPNLHAQYKNKGKSYRKKDLEKKETRASKDAEAIGLSIRVAEQKVTELQDALEAEKIAHQEDLDGEKEKRAAARDEEIRRRCSSLTDDEFTWLAGSQPDKDTQHHWNLIQRRRAGTMTWLDKMNSIGMNLSEDFVAENIAKWIREGTGIVKYTVRFTEIDSKLPIDLRPENAQGKDLKIDAHTSTAILECEHPLRTTRLYVKVSMELMANLMNLSVWDRTMEMTDIERRALNIAKSQQQINQDRYAFDTVTQNTIKIFLGYVMHHMQSKSELDFILGPKGTHITSVTVIERTKFLYQRLGQLKRMLTLLASLCPTLPSVARYLQVLASIGLAYAYHMLTQMTQGPWSKAYLNESRQHLLALTKHFLKSSAGSFLTGSRGT